MPLSEAQLRRRAARCGYGLRRSRARSLHIDNHGGWMIIDPSRNRIVAGERYDLTDDDVEAFLSDDET